MTKTMLAIAIVYLSLSCQALADPSLDASKGGTPTPQAAPAEAQSPSPQLPSPSPEAQSPQAERRNTIELGTSNDNLSNGQARWSQSKAVLTEHGDAGQPTIFEQWAEQDEFGLHDDQETLGTVLSATPHTHASLQLATSSSHHVLPSFDGTTSVEERFGGGFGTAFAYERRTYATVNVNALNVTVDRYFGPFYIAYLPVFSQLAGTPGTAVTHKVSVARYDNRGGDLTLNFFAGHDPESIGPGKVEVLNVSGISLNGHQVVAPNVAIAYGVETFTEGTLYTATGMNLGLRYAF
jgi:YaiO family outer membrane protein